MDNYVRGLERRFEAGQLTDAEKYRLQERYCSLYGYCPIGFVVQRLIESLDSYIAFLHESHIQKLANVRQVFATVSAQLPDDQRRRDWDVYLTNYLESRVPDLLNVTYTLTQLANLPLIVVKATVRLPALEGMDRDAQQDWYRTRDGAADHIRNILQARFSQCHYFDCVIQHPRSLPPALFDREAVVNVVGVGFPIPLVNQTEGLTEQLERIADPLMRQQINRALSVRMPRIHVGEGQSSPLNPILCLKLVVPVSANGMESCDLTNFLREESLTSGYLILAGVSNRTFLHHAEDRGRADRELTAVWETEIEELPEMIYFFSPADDRLVIVPAGSAYYKTCRFLRLVAGV